MFGIPKVRTSFLLTANVINLHLFCSKSKLSPIKSTGANLARFGGFTNSLKRFNNQTFTNMVSQNAPNLPEVRTANAVNPGRQWLIKQCQRVWFRLKARRRILQLRQSTICTFGNIKYCLRSQTLWHEWLSLFFAELQRFSRIPRVKKQFSML